MDKNITETQVPYTPGTIEPRWQERWESSQIYKTKESQESDKYYCLDYFPYPSGEGLHVGHCRNYVPTDVYSRYLRMKGYNVLHPMGWDAFGEPTEHHAILKGNSPRETTDRNTANFKRQLRLLGTSYDWEREIDSSSPDYYRWTQWFFLKMYERGLVYRNTSWQWWCPTCSTTLSNNEIKGDECWRGHKGITKKEIPAWFFKITDYADELLSGLDEIEWPEPIKMMQKNWIGRSEGVDVFWEFDRKEDNEQVQGIHLSTFTTRVDTIYGVTFIAVAPEHSHLMKFTTKSNISNVVAYINQAIKKPDRERSVEGGKVSGVFSGAYVSHPMTGEKIPVYVADYVLPTYGSGAVMGVPAHDSRDARFAKKYGLNIRKVIHDYSQGISGLLNHEVLGTGSGVLVNSGPFDGMKNERAEGMITQWLEKAGKGCRTVNTHLRDWLISRQRYWGTPIPIVYCDSCGIVPVPDKELPIELPAIERYAPDGSGISPLARVESFFETRCPACGKPARRETDTMGGFACSSWYFLRFTDPKNQVAPFDQEAIRYWMPVDLYVGGAEHAVLHLLYARFWTKFLADEGYLQFREPFSRLINQGLMHGEDGQKMSKIRGNVVSPDPLIEEYGADALRIHCLFMAPFENNVDWQEAGIIGSMKFLKKVWTLILSYGISHDHSTSDNRDDSISVEDSLLEDKLEKERNRIVKEVTEKMEDFRFNTMVSNLMEFVNQLLEFARKHGWQYRGYQKCLETLLILLAPSAPHITEELWERLGKPFSIHQQSWPEWEESHFERESYTIPVQVDGRLRGKINLRKDSEQVDAVNEALKNADVQKAVISEIIRSVYLPGKILNIVTEKS